MFINLLTANPSLQTVMLTEFQDTTIGLVIAKPADVMALPVDSFVFSCEHTTGRTLEESGFSAASPFCACDDGSPQWGSTFAFSRDATMCPPKILGSYAYDRRSQISRAARRMSAQALEWADSNRLSTMAFTAPMGTAPRDNGGRILSTYHAALALFGGLFTFFEENPARSISGIIVPVPNMDSFDVFGSVLRAYLFVSSYDHDQNVFAVCQASKKLCAGIRQFIQDHPDMPGRTKTDILAKAQAFSSTIPEQGKVGARGVARWIKEQRAMERWNELISFAIEKLSAYGYEPAAYTIVDTIIRTRAEKLLAENLEERNLRLREVLLPRLIEAGAEQFLRECGIDPETNPVEMTNARRLALAGGATRADMEQIRALLDNPDRNDFDRGLVVIATTRFQNMIAMFLMGRARDTSSFNDTLSSDADHRALMRDMQLYMDGIGGRDLAPYVLADTGILRGERYIETLESTLRGLQRLWGEIGERTLELMKRGRPV